MDRTALELALRHLRLHRLHLSLASRKLTIKMEKILAQPHEMTRFFIADESIVIRSMVYVYTLNVSACTVHTACGACYARWKRIYSSLLLCPVSIQCARVCVYAVCCIYFRRHAIIEHSIDAADISSVRRTDALELDESKANFENKNQTKINGGNWCALVVSRGTYRHCRQRDWICYTRAAVPLGPATTGNSK